MALSFAPQIQAVGEGLRISRGTHAHGLSKPCVPITNRWYIPPVYGVEPGIVVRTANTEPYRTKNKDVDARDPIASALTQ
jgi:hypothetical protein